MTGVYLLLVVLAVATAFGLWRRRTDGRLLHIDHDGPTGAGAPPTASTSMSPVASPSGAGLTPDSVAPVDDSEPLIVDGHPVEPDDHAVEPEVNALGAAEIGADLGERATLVQFSSAFCTPCRATRVVLGDVVRMVPGVAHVEIDAESHLELVRRLDVTRTPTVLVLDAAGRIRKRATGAPRRADVIAAIGEIA